MFGYAQIEKRSDFYVLGVVIFEKRCQKRNRREIKSVRISKQIPSQLGHLHREKVGPAKDDCLVVRDELFVRNIVQLIFPLESWIEQCSCRHSFANPYLGVF
jgi:hypothetical protein